MTSPWYHPAGSTSRDGFEVAITPGSLAGAWRHTGLYVVQLAPGESRAVTTGDCEWIVLPLAGVGWRVESPGEPAVELRGRTDVWDGPSDQVYLPRDTAFTVTAIGGGTLALPHARARTPAPVAVTRAEEVPVELRGAGSCSRQVHNFGTPAALAADSIIACEVYTPAGNWSSYPPHKHDEEGSGETALEEIYYFEVADGPAGPGMAYQRVYGTADRPIDVLAEVRTGDAVLIPHGWHGPSIATPGYDLYYLNVMAGPGVERAWRICDDPAHAWVRQTWPEQLVDPRLPLTRAR